MAVGDAVIGEWWSQGRGGGCVHKQVNTPHQTNEHTNRTNEHTNRTNQTHQTKPNKTKQTTPKPNKRSSASRTEQADGEVRPQALAVAYMTAKEHGDGVCKEERCVEKAEVRLALCMVPVLAFMASV